MRESGTGERHTCNLREGSNREQALLLVVAQTHEHDIQTARMETDTVRSLKLRLVRSGDRNMG